MIEAHAALARVQKAGGHLVAFGAREAAQVFEATLDRARDALTIWWNEPLSIKDAEAWGGYSASQLRRLIAEGTVPVAPDGRLRRKDVPVRPGHKLPLGLEPEPEVKGDWTDELNARRQQAAGQ